MMVIDGFDIRFVIVPFGALMTVVALTALLFPGAHLGLALRSVGAKRFDPSDPALL